MALTLQDIAKIANLARLEIPPASADNTLQKLNSFFDIVEQMRAVNTQGIEPMAHPTHAMDAAVQSHIQLRLRDDIVSEVNNREANQRSAPAVERGLFLVPKVIE